MLADLRTYTVSLWVAVSLASFPPTGLIIFYFERIPLLLWMQCVVLQRPYIIIEGHISRCCLSPSWPRRMEWISLRQVPSLTII